MDSAASKTKRISRTLDESGHKFGGDVNENLSDQGKGGSLSSTQEPKGEDVRMLSVRAQKRLSTLGDVVEKGGKVNDLFRLMEDTSLWMCAYMKLQNNSGALTKGVNNNTLDGFSIDRVENLIETLKENIYLHKPVRRVYIPKSNGDSRPLGIPTGDDKLVQEVCRVILDAIYGRSFSDLSHGFIQGRSCHTALTQIKTGWNGVKWIVNVDVKGFFDNINHKIMIRLLEKKIDDKRFIILIKQMLHAGYMDNWVFHKTFSGTPQGGVISPILSNIYLHELDQMAEKRILRFSNGMRRARNPDYRKLEITHSTLSKKLGRRLRANNPVMGGVDEIEEIRSEMDRITNIKRETPSTDQFDANFRRLKYCRYADDFVFGVIGSKTEALEIFKEVKFFLSKELDLEVSQDKSGISNFKDGFNYLGYLVRSETSGRLRKKYMERDGGGKTRYLQRSFVGKVSLRVPPETGMKFAKVKGYIRKGDLVPIHRGHLENRSIEEIIIIYNSELRGLANYYSLAVDVKNKLGRLEHLTHQSLMKTLAGKGKTTVRKVRTQLSRHGEFIYPTEERGKRRNLIVYRLKHMKKANFDYEVDTKPTAYQNLAFSRTELYDRVNANECENCGVTRGYFEVHHVNKMATMKKGNHPAIIGLKRKTIVLCVSCHTSLHSGKLPDLRRRRD